MMKRFVRSVRSESAFGLLSGALLLTLVAVLAAIAFDSAVFLARVHRARWEAEGMAMAAARELRQTSDQEAASRAARDWVIRNDVDPSRAECCSFADLRPVTGPDGYADTVTATSRVTQDTFFLHLLGLPKTVSIKRAATAQVVGAEGGPVCPWGVLGDPSDVTAQDGSYFGILPGRVYAVDLSVAPQEPGDFLPLDLTKTGVVGYLEAIAHGCREDEAGVWSAGDRVGVISNGSDVARSTRQALGDHYSFESADGFADYLGLKWCDIDFQFDGQGAPVGHTTGFSPYLQPPRTECVRGTLDGGAGRIVLVPVVSRLSAAPGSPVQVLGLAAMYIVSWDRGDSSTGGSGQVYGMFLDRARVNTTDLVGEDDNPLAPLRIVLVH
jgi:hypothetical protein